MKFHYHILLILILLFSCESDDICAESTPTTPRVRIQFFDSTAPDDLKNVPRLTVYGEALVLDENGNPTQPTTSLDQGILEGIDENPVFNTNENEIALPLLIGNEGENTTLRYIFEKDTNLRLDDDDTASSNIDIIEISYTSEYVYVSRACGYKSIFSNLTVTVIADTDEWISSITIDETTIANEATVHLRIFH